MDWKSARDGLKKSGRHISHCQTASSCQRHALSVLSFECSLGVLQSRRGAAKHQGCCKAQGVLQSTRGAAKHKGSTGDVLQSTKLLVLDLTGACTISACTL